METPCGSIRAVSRADPTPQAPVTVRFWEVWGEGRRSVTTARRRQVRGSGPEEVCVERVQTTRASRHCRIRRCRPRRTDNPSRSPGSLADRPDSTACRQAFPLSSTWPLRTMRQTAQQGRMRARPTPESLSNGSETPGTSCRDFSHVQVRVPSQIAVSVERQDYAQGRSVCFPRDMANDEPWVVSCIHGRSRRSPLA